MQRLKRGVTLKRRTRAILARGQRRPAKKLAELIEIEVRRITPAACRDWATRYAKTFSPTRYNGALSLSSAHF